jgi:hypothetical protein
VINTAKWGHPVCSRIVAVQPPDLVFSSAAAVVKTVAGVLVLLAGVLVMSAVWGACIGSGGVGAEPVGQTPTSPRSMRELE